jgi:hypothetical protein
MLVRIARASILSVSLMLGAGLGISGALADDLADFDAAVETISNHDRAAIDYLRGGNMDMASLEIDQLREAWRALQQRFAGKPPHAFDGNPLYPNLFTGVSARLVAADMMLKSGRPEAAIQSLDAIRSEFHELRKALVR